MLSKEANIFNDISDNQRTEVIGSFNWSFLDTYEHVVEKEKEINQMEGNFYYLLWTKCFDLKILNEEVYNQIKDDEECSSKKYQRYTLNCSNWNNEKSERRMCPIFKKLKLLLWGFNTKIDGLSSEFKNKLDIKTNFEQFKHIPMYKYAKSIYEFELTVGNKETTFITNNEIEKLGKEYYGDVIMEWRAIPNKRTYQGRYNEETRKDFANKMEYSKYIKKHKLP